MGFLWEAPQNSNILISLHNLRITLVAENTYCLLCISNILNNVSQTQVHIKEGRLTPKLRVTSYVQVFYWHLIGTSLLIWGNHLGICEDPNQSAKIIIGGKFFNWEKSIFWARSQDLGFRGSTSAGEVGWPRGRGGSAKPATGSQRRGAASQMPQSPLEGGEQQGWDSREPRGGGRCLAQQVQLVRNYHVTHTHCKFHTKV